MRATVVLVLVFLVFKDDGYEAGSLDDFGVAELQFSLFSVSENETADTTQFGTARLGCLDVFARSHGKEEGCYDKVDCMLKLIWRDRPAFGSEFGQLAQEFRSDGFLTRRGRRQVIVCAEQPAQGG